jgi:AcrR family transcriptional regulator
MWHPATLDPVNAAERRAPYRKPEEVRADLLAATRELLAERPARQVTVREIAARAGTQHSMITRHFGSKDALVATAVGAVASDYAAAVDSADGPGEGYVAALRHLRRLPMSGMVLTTPDAERAGEGREERFPGYAAHLRQLLDAGAPDDLRTRVLAGLTLGTVVAWSLMDGTILEAAGIDRDRAPEVDAVVEQLVADLVRSQLPGPADA